MRDKVGTAGQFRLREAPEFFRAKARTLNVRKKCWDSGTAGQNEKRADGSLIVVSILFESY